MSLRRHWEQYVIARPRRGRGNLVPHCHCEATSVAVAISCTDSCHCEATPVAVAISCKTLHQIAASGCALLAMTRTLTVIARPRQWPWQSLVKPCIRLPRRACALLAMTQGRNVASLLAMTSILLLPQSPRPRARMMKFKRR